ncbi:MAG TPA: cysteine--tRNA ligase [Pseudolabrys sp.]|nr:cysteine--tRNA ligase [Pseudolabrys sp.]
MELKLYDTLTREKRVFSPIDPARVRMYVCGPTVYDFAHIGNARPVIVFDVLFRLLRYVYGEKHVTYVRNITDVDDKINARAAERSISIRELTEETYKNFKADVAALGCLPPTIEPRATDHIEEMKTLIERLVKSGNAYVAEDHVLFHVASMKDYGKLSNRSLDEMIAGARVEVAPFKKDPMDFVLWKPSGPDEPAWPSPAGIKRPGRPGWHIECSAMSWKHLGETFDVHGGGIDLVFPHNENEIAQSRCAFHTPVMANFWMHNGFLQVEGEKMSKSLGNFITIHDLLKDWPGEVIRLNMLRTHYRQPIDWTAKGLEETQHIVESWKKIVAGVDPLSAQITPSENVLAALCDDLNSPEAISALHKIGSAGNANELYANLVFLGIVADQRELAENIAREVLEEVKLPPKADKRTERYLLEAEIGKRIFTLNPSANATTTSTAAFTVVTSSYSIPSFLDAWTKYHSDFLSPVDVQYVHNAIGFEKLNEEIEKRLLARSARNFPESDRIRNELRALGFELEDTKDGKTQWKVAR